MTDLETILMCALIPVVYVVTYMAGKYDLLGQLAQMLQEKTASLTDEYTKVVRCKNCKKWDSQTGSCNEFTTHRFPAGGRITFLTQENDFCSYGERKDNGKA